ncbi:electron transfer flavoprotein subunit alpha/FixB family protein, partial [Planosporangium thailandense]
MAEVLVVVEATQAFGVKKVTCELLTAARALGEPAAVVLGGPGAAAAMADKLAEYGAGKIYAAESEEITGHLVAPKATVLAALVKRVAPAAVLLAASQEGKEIAGRLAVKLDNGILTDAVGLDADGTATQVVFAGSTIVQSKVTRGIPLVTLRPNSVTPEAAPASPVVEQLTVELTDADKLATVVNRVAEQKGSRPELTEASIVVSGGRGVGSGDNFKLVEELADLLGAAVGASRAAVDSGFYPHQFQVGQTGKTVSPQLYIALGISGAIQHR